MGAEVPILSPAHGPGASEATDVSAHGPGASEATAVSAVGLSDARERDLTRLAKSQIVTHREDASTWELNILESRCELARGQL